MRIWSSILISLALLCAGASPALAQGNEPPATLIVMPFENASGAPGLQWVSEAFPEILGQRLSGPTIFTLTRDDRLRAYERAEIPAEVLPTRATIYRLVEQMDVDYVVLGRYAFDGRVLTASAQLLDVQHRKLFPECQDSGPLPELIRVETALSWDLLHTLRPSLSVDKQTFTTSAPSLRLDALENYVRGILAGTASEKIQHFREAVRINPGYNQAWLRLGKAYYNEHQYDEAIAALSRVSPNDPSAREADFFLGLSAYELSDFSRAQEAFNRVAVQLPLPEVYNNLGVASARLGDRKQAVSDLRKAVEADASDADYQFNLAAVLAQSGDAQQAIHHLKLCLSSRPGDGEARSLLDSLSGTSRSNSARLVPGRVKSNYDENSFRQFVLGIQSAAEERLAKTPPAIHAQYHVGRGQELLSAGFAVEADREFREATHLDPANAEAHAGLARALEAENNIPEARAEAEAALRIKVFIDPLLLLARLDLRDNRTDAAADRVDRALKLDPANASALTLKRAVAAKAAEKPQPLPN
ncbi:MAG TPA: tetratricopeptide repeat protein [Terriglobales bacterium]|nr:tetratricopeptide repeat protein [Terriglobales bacterium]